MGRLVKRGSIRRNTYTKNIQKKEIWKPTVVEAEMPKIYTKVNKKERGELLQGKNSKWG